MSPHQLSLWDNESLETGSNCLAALELEEAIGHFNKALQAGIGDRDSIQKLIEACEYWQVRIQYSSPNAGATNSHSEQINALLSAYVHYFFTPQMGRFKKALLTHVVDLMCNEASMDLVDMEIAFDLLVEMGDLQKAEDMVSYSIIQHPEKRLLLYLLAQVQWLSGNRSEANNNYVTLLLYHPGEIKADRIENKKLIELIQTYGAPMAPAYGWLRNVVSLVSLPDDIEIYDDQHRKAIECYRLLREANKALEKNERNLSTQYRKQLKALVPDLFAEYFNWVQQIR